MNIGIWGAGLVGRSLALELAKRGQSVCILNRSVDKQFLVNGHALPMRQMSFRSNETEMHAALDGLDAVVHCAGSPSDDFTEFSAAAERLAKASCHVGLRRVLMLSTVAVYGDALQNDGLTSGLVIEKSLEPKPTTPYARSRYLAEISMRDQLSNHRVEFSVVRVPMILGPMMTAQLFVKMTHLLNLGLFPDLGTPTACLPCIRVERLAWALAGLTTQPDPTEPVYQFSESLLWSSILRSYSEKTGRRVRSIPLPGLFLYRVLRALGARRSVVVLRSMMNESVYRDDWEGGATADDGVSLHGHGGVSNNLQLDMALSDILWERPKPEATQWR
jgi:nucleoside-diphosphate-sugar epimerase